jgi:hypothetical protein
MTGCCSASARKRVATPPCPTSREYLAFSANDTGRYEIYVQRFQGDGSPKLVGERRRVSHNGGNFPPGGEMVRSFSSFPRTARSWG